MAFQSMAFPLFKRQDNRVDNTTLADFLHGHCLRFQDFTYSVLKANKSVHVPLCLECSIKPDSVHHKIFECVNFESSFRNNLAVLIGNLETNFHLPIIFHTQFDETVNAIISEDHGLCKLNCNMCSAREDLKQQISLICDNSMFGDDMLQKNYEKRNRQGCTTAGLDT